MSAMKSKIKSRAGASITFALLLFLVCAVVSSVVIVAATAAGGRMSEMAQMDQRYYAVTSAAGLLRDVLEGQTATIIERTITNGTRSSDGTTEWGDSPSTDTPIVLLDDADITTVMNVPIVADAAQTLLMPDYESAYNEQNNDLSSELESDTLKVSVKEYNLTAIKDSLDETKSGTFELFVSQAENKEAPTNAYTLKLTFKADINASVDTHEELSLPKSVINDDGTTAVEYDVTKTETKTTTVRWKCTDIIKSVLPEEGEGA